MTTTRERIDGSSPMGSNFSDKMQNLSGAVEKSSKELGNKLGSAIETATDQAAVYVDETRTYVKSHPLQSVLVAAGVGVLCGSLISMASRRH